MKQWKNLLYSRRIWTATMDACFFAGVPVDWESVEIWGLNMLAAVVYHIWQQRNALLHGNNPRSEEAILAHIMWEVRARIMAKGHFN
jgi:hypothetical protein